MSVVASREPQIKAALFNALVAKRTVELERSLVPKLAAHYDAVLRTIAKQVALTAAADWQPPPDGVLITDALLARLAKQLNESLAQLRADIVSEVGNAPLVRIEIAWDIKHPLPQGLLEQASQRTGQRLGSAAQHVLRQAVADAYDQGLSARDAQAAVRSALTDAAPWQADMLARTDMTMLANGASKAAAQLAGMAYKTWDATLDARTRPTHADAHGQSVPINDTFVVGGEEAQYPGDPALSDEESANCRCSLIYGGTLSEAEALLSDAEVTIMSGMKTRQRKRLAARRNGTGRNHATQTQPWQSEKWWSLRKDAQGIDWDALTTEEMRQLVALLDRASPGSGLALTAGATSSTFPLSDRTRPWDGGAALQRWEAACGLGGSNPNWTRFHTGFFWFDSANAQTVGAHHLLYVDIIGGQPTAVWRGVTTCAAAMQGSRGATMPEIPPADKASIRSHIGSYYTAAAKKFGDASIKVPWASGSGSASAELATLPAGVKECSMNGTPGYSGGGMCHLHDGTPAGRQKAIRSAQGDARSRSGASLLADARPVAFQGTAGVEGILADDNSIAPRVLLPDSLSWPEMPVSFLAQTVTAEAHDGAQVAGRVDEFARKRGTGRMRNIMMKGEFTNSFGIDEIAPMVADETMKYVSMDLGATEWSLVERATLAQVGQEDFDMSKATAGEYALGLLKGKIKATTLVATQALPGAMIALVASADECGIGIEDPGGEALLACATAGTWLPDPEREFTVMMPALEFAASEDGQALVAAAATPARPSRAWFETQEPPGKMPLTITEEGRVYGHLATWDSCHTGFLPSCVPPPKSASNYARFHVGEIDTDDGVVNVGVLMQSDLGGHADRRLSASAARIHYDKTGMVGAYLRVVDGQHGIWAAGVLNPDLSDAQAEAMRRKLRLHPPSGDWRPMDGGYELICAFSVPVPGFNTPRANATVTITASADGIEMTEAIIASSGTFEADPAAVAAMADLGLASADAEAERRMHTLAARAEGGMEALVALID